MNAILCNAFCSVVLNVFLLPFLFSVSAWPAPSPPLPPTTRPACLNLNLHLVPDPCVATSGCIWLLALVVSHFYLAVKYLREVTPYIRKASLLNEIGWDLQRQFLGFSNTAATLQTHQPATKTNDTRSIPLLHCFLARQLKWTDKADNHLLEIHSPDGQQSCFLRAPDSLQASQWYVHCPHQ